MRYFTHSTRESRCHPGADSRAFKTTTNAAFYLIEKENYCSASLCVNQDDG